MPIQTNETGFVYFPDGCKVSVKRPGDASYFDVGATNSAVGATFEFEENRVISSNAGPLRVQIRNPTVSGGFTLINLNPIGVERMGGGLFTREETTDTPVTTNLTDQVVSSGWTNKGLNDIEIINSSSNVNYIASALSITSVTASVSGVLAADDDYTIHPNDNSRSRFAISFNTAGSAGVSTTEDITIVFASVTPITSQIIYMGQSTAILEAYQMLFTHTDDNGKVRQYELFAVDASSGGFQFNFKGANEDGVEEMPITFVANLDATLTSGKQLGAWTIETGAA